MTTPCRCPLAGWCETHGRTMNAVRHRQCREEPGYFEAFGKRREARPIAAPVPRPKKPRGLGDSIERLTQATGLDKLAKAVERVTGKPCGCGKRRDALNRLVPYKGDGPPTAPQAPPSSP